MLFTMFPKTTFCVSILLQVFCLATPTPSQPIPHNEIARDLVMTNVDILIPDGNGSLIRPSTQEQRSLLLTKRQRPGQVTAKGDGYCRTAKKIDNSACVLFCNTQTSIVKGSPSKISADVYCDVSTCPVAHSYATTITETYSIDVGITAIYGNAKKGIEGMAMLGFSHTWSKAVTTADTYTFTPTKGDEGHIIFIPYMEEACGPLTTFAYSNTEYFECLDYSKDRKDGVNYNHVTAYAPMSCGQSVMKLDSGSADGVSHLPRISMGA